jgi:E3 ubiquitin-protein ligase SIAH1
MKSSKYPPAPTAPPPSPLLLQLLDNLNCPVCIDKMEPPITMCVNGHSICCRCRQQLDRCPVCRGCHSPMRNFFAETAFSLLVDKVRCKYVASGCRHELLDRHEVEEHESLCQYR